MPETEDTRSSCEANYALPHRWKNVKFGNVVNNCRETEKNPLEHGLERFIGLNDLDPADLKIKRWGMISEGTSFTRKFLKGQVLFGKRRAYQHKAALADFDGICSGDILVFKSKNDRILAELLPFIVQSDNFFNYAIKTSAGSLSPRTSWKHLKKYIFPLPPLDEQKRIAELLWAIEHSIRKWEDTIELAERYKKALMKHLFTYGPVGVDEIENIKLKKTKIGMVREDWEVKRISKIGKFRKGKGITKKDVVEKGIACVRYGELYTTHDTVIREFHSFIEDKNIAGGTLIKTGDIIFAGSGETREEIGKSAAYVGTREAYAGGDIIIFTPSKINSVFLSYFLNSMAGIKQTMRLGQGWSVVHIYKHHLEKVLVPIPDEEEQIEVESIFENIHHVVEIIKQEILHLTSLKSFFLNNLLSGQIRLGGPSND